MVWFHGGCFIGGSPEGYDGSALVEDAGGDVIVVTVAFRLGVFGHLASVGLKARSVVG
jgi:carboxylesterase type B